MANMILYYLANGIYDAFKNNKIFYYRYIIEYKSYLENHIWYDYIFINIYTHEVCNRRCNRHINKRYFC